MTINFEKLKLQLIETQMTVLQYQHKEVSANIAALETQAKFDASVDAHDMPSGVIKQPDEFKGD